MMRATTTTAAPITYLRNAPPSQGSASPHRPPKHRERTGVTLTGLYTGFPLEVAVTPFPPEWDAAARATPRRSEPARARVPVRARLAGRPVPAHGPAHGA